MQDRTPSRLLLFRCWLRFCASCARDSTGRRANVAPGRFALFASCSPDVSCEGRVQIVFGDNRASRVNYFEFSCRVAAVFESRPRRSTKARCPGEDCSSGGCNRVVSAAESPPIFCAGPVPCAFLAPRGASCRRKPSRLRPRHRGKVLQSRQAGRGPHRFCPQFGESVGHGWVLSVRCGSEVASGRTSHKRTAKREQRVRAANGVTRYSSFATITIRRGGYSYQAHPILPRRSANLSLTFCRNSGLARATMGKSASRSNGRQASMMARELVELALSSNGSSGPLQARRTKSMSLAGSQRVQIAHITSNRSVGSTSSSTTATKRPRYDADWQPAASRPAWPGLAGLARLM